ncbi:hypothetical protein FOC4_g10007513 [Fusarium odoratissimum]|uniref:Transcription factor domain-containing protein n=1 Tax=Fusarium oxysporum f. sp. cubense (strain race 4) TaxID=2502994 RepID=N1RKD9_FUSC4|nr:hypothetical protein FOC4_g10007513 [Fusarium odoratissimum]
MVAVQSSGTEPGMNESEIANLTEIATSDLEASAGIVAPSPDSFLGTSSGRSLIGVCANTGQQPEGDRVSGGSDLPSKEVGDKLIEAYHARLHPKHPFLPRRRVRSLQEARFELIPAHKDVRSEGSTLRRITMSDLRDLATLCLRHSRYQLRSPTGPGVWWMIETTMRYCIDNGLHRQATNLPPSLDERRKRIFWTASRERLRLVAATIESDHETNDGLLRSVDNLHVSRDGFQPGFVADESGYLETWNSFESILGDHEIDLGTWMHDSIFDTTGTFQPMDWTE